MNILNVFTKKITGDQVQERDLISDKDVALPVKKLYYEYKNECKDYFSDLPEHDITDKRYYVYAWYADTNPRKYFYVGKGTGTHYRHIKQEIAKSRKGAENIRWERYAMIESQTGIACEILLDHLTEFEAFLYKQCMKLKMLDEGEVLLNVEGIPEDKLPEGWYGAEKQDGKMPTLMKDPFYAHYLSDFREPYFDPVTEEDLMYVYIYPYFLAADNPKVIQDKKAITDWLNWRNAKVYKTLSMKTKAVIIQGNLMFDTYIRFREQGKKILSSYDVLAFIQQDLPYIERSAMKS